MKEFIKDYYITEDGAVFSNIEGRGLRKLKPVNNRGYLIITIRKKCYRIHRLVAEAFIPKVEGKAIVNHIDGNKLNNEVSNLEWCTQSENVQHAWDKGLANRERAGLYKGVYKLDMNSFEVISEYISIKEAEEHNPKAKGHISACCRGNRSNAGGFYWVYVDSYNSETVKQNIRLQNPMTGSSNPSSRKILCVTTGEVFETIKEAAKKYDLDCSNICSCCRGKLQTSGGKTWKYID